MYPYMAAVSGLAELCLVEAAVCMLRPSFHPGIRTAEKCYVTSDVWSARMDHAVLGRPVHQGQVKGIFFSQEFSPGALKCTQFGRTQFSTMVIRELCWVIVQGITHRPDLWWVCQWYNNHLMKKQSILQEPFRFTTSYMNTSITLVSKNKDILRCSKKGYHEQQGMFTAYILSF